jgi:hypothetical protein
MVHVQDIELVFKRLKDELFRLDGELQHIEALMNNLDNIAKTYQKKESPEQFLVELGIGDLYLEAYTYRSNIQSLRLALYELEMALAQIAVDGPIPKGVTWLQPPEYKAYITYVVNRRTHGHPIWFNQYTAGVAFSLSNP